MSKNIDKQKIVELMGSNVLDVEGNRIGTLDNVYYDDESPDSPSFITVATGFFGNDVHFVPLTKASIQDDQDVVVNYTTDEVKNSPHIAPEAHISEEKEDELYRYYGMNNVRSKNQAISNFTSNDGQKTSPNQKTTNDNMMTRSEEELVVDKEQRKAGTVRLKKYVVTENVDVSVPVRKEKVKVIREAVTDGEIETNDIIDKDVVDEVTLMEEVPKVSKKVIAKEKVRLGKEAVTENQKIHDTVRKEKIDIEDKNISESK